MSARASRTAEASGAEDNLELRAWLRLVGCANLVTGHLRHRLRREFDMSLPTFDILAQIARPPLGPTMGELSKRLVVSKGSVTDLIERLEGKGVVSRSADPSDGRVQHVHLTAKGQRLLAQTLPAHNAWIKSLMAGMEPASAARLFAALGELKEALRGADGGGRSAPARRDRSSAQRQLGETP